MFNKTPAIEQVEQLKTSMDSMKEFVDLVNNPEKVTAAHEAVRKEHTLTDEHVKRYNEALSFSEKYEELADTYNEHVTSLEAAEKNHEASVIAHNTKVEEDTKALNERKEKIEAGERQLIADRKKFEDECEEKRQEYSLTRTPIDDEIEQNRKDKEANEKERIRLQKLEKKLQKRDEKVLASLTNDNEEEAA